MAFAPPAPDEIESPAFVPPAPDEVANSFKPPAPDEAVQPDLSKIKGEPVNQPSQFSSGMGNLVPPGQNPDWDFTSAVANDPVGFVKSVPGSAIKFAGATMSAWAQQPYLAAADAVSKATGDPEYGGNLKAAWSEANPDEPLPVDKFFTEVSKANRALGVVGKISEGIAATAPMMGIGALPKVAQVVIARAFTADMLAHAPGTATDLYKELKKPAAEQDPDKVTSLISDFTQQLGFGALGAAHEMGNLGNALVDKYVPRGTGIEGTEMPPVVTPTPTPPNPEATDPVATETPVTPEPASAETSVEQPADTSNDKPAPTPVAESTDAAESAGVRPWETLDPEAAQMPPPDSLPTESVQTSEPDSKPVPSPIENPVTPEDLAQNAVLSGKPLDAQFVEDNGFEKQLAEHGYEKQADQWVPADAGENEVAGFGGKATKSPQKVNVPPAVAGSPAPQIHPFVQALNAHATGLKSVIAPQTLDLGARDVGNAMRHFMGENAMAMTRADDAMHSFRNEFDQTPVPKDFKYDPAQPLPHNYAVIDAMERDPSKLPARYQQLAATFQKEFQWRIAAIQKYAPNALQHLIQNYFPHIWEDPKRAGDAMAQVASRLFSGRKEFLKERSLPFFKDGLERGLKPISDNPVDLLLAKMHSMDKFLLALKATSEFKRTGAMKFKYLFENLPDGWQTIDDPSFIVQKPPVVTVTEAFDQFQRAKLGEVLQDLGVDYKRVASLGGGRWAEADRGMKEIRAQVGADEGILWHEAGHHLDWRFPQLREFMMGTDADRKSLQGLKLRKAPIPANLKQVDKLNTQLRALVDLNHPGRAHNPNSTYDKYLRSTPEKMAEVIRAYAHAPELFQKTAPDVWKAFTKFLDTQPRLRDQLNELKQGSLTIGHESTDIKLGGMQVLGHWIMPDGGAQVIKNHLSPGLSQFAAYRTFKAASNILNAAQLGLSGFHLGFTSLDAATSRLAIGIEDLSQGKVLKAAKTFGSVPASPVTNILQGRRMMQEALHPGSTDQETAQLVKALEQAGGRIGQDKFWQTDFMRRLKRAWSAGTATGYLKSLPLAPLTAVEQALRPIMEYVVPRQKLGVFADMARRELDRLGPNASVQDSREAMRKAWDSVDNRMGQVVYDNLFYNRMVKDVALMSFRAYGWQLGKYREGLGALADTGAAAKQIAAGKRPEVSHRMAYALALPLMVGTIGGTINYMMTGQAPQDWRDYFMPRTGQTDTNGNASRLNLPSYMKDVLAYAKHPLTSLGHSLNPMFSGIFDVLENKDFYDTQIRNPDDPLWKQGADVAKFAAKQFIPFSVSGAVQMHEQGTPIQKEILPFFGITPAPMRMTMTPAQELAAEITGANMPAAPRTKEQFDRSKLVREIVQDFRDGQNTAGRTTLAQGFQTGQLNANTVQTIIDKMKFSPLEFQVHHMDVSAAMRVWRVANDQERSKLTPMVELKVAASKTLTPVERQGFMDELNRK